MSLFARCIGLFVIFGLTLPMLISAQEKKKDAKPAEKKDAKEPKEGRDDDNPKKKDKKSSEPEEKLVYGQTLQAKMKRIDANSNRDFTIEMKVVDPQKVYDVNFWKMQQLQSIAQSQNQQQYRDRMQYYQHHLAQKDVTSWKDFDLRGSDQIKVRSLYPPIEYDDRGFLKKWTKKELAALKGESKLPGYPSTMENLRPGQFVQVYLAKTKAPSKLGQKKKGDDDDAAFDRPEVVMVVITQEVGPGGN